MNTRNISRWAQQGLLTLSTMAAAVCHAQTINFAQAPAGASAREPAPNVIVSVDDSGSMGAAGMTTLREALTSTFGIGSNLADDRIRLAWQSMNRCPALGSSSPACGVFNGMRYLSGTHRANFDAWARGLTQAGGTPGHRMMDNAGQYLSATIGTDVNSPWAADPGSTLNPVLSCRKSFHIFMTDGGWNSGATTTPQHIDTSATNNGARIVRGGGNADNIAKALPDGTNVYVVNPLLPGGDQTRLYRDAWGGATTTSNGVATTLSTLSDLAFHYWSTDLQPGLTNDVRPTINRATSETFVATNGSSTTLGPFWNPRNNPATWQHMVNYTIGFNTAAAWTGSPTWGGDTFSGGLPDLINGVNAWGSPFCGAANAGSGNRPCDGSTGYGNSATEGAAALNGRRMDLWHAALNGRGRFVPAPNAQALVDAFQTIVNDILTQSARPLVSIATSSTRASANNFAYVAGYDSAANWKGTLKAFAINRTTSRPATTPTWEADVLLDNLSAEAIANRVVLTHNGSQGVGFRWDNLSDGQRLALRGSTSVPAGTGAARVNYLRGDRQLESSQTGGFMRNRSSRLGDIVNSNIWHLGKPTRQPIELPGHAAFRSSNAGRPAVLYVGANDGMLHGFDAASGREVMAYVPAGLYGNETFSPLRAYTQTSYSHRYFVDGSPFTGDVNIGADSGEVDWRTLLVGTLGAGGKGYFVLDVTNPSNFAETSAAAESLVRLDTTVNTHPDIGHVFATPVVDGLTRSRSEQIVRVNDTNAGGRWAVILGNGYNSTNQRPVLVVQYLDGTMGPPRLIQASAATGQGNGLGAPRPVDLNGDGKVDVVFAGDLKGNLWKFDLSSDNPSEWGVAFGGQPLFVARDPDGNVQPITAAPYWQVGPNNLGGLQVLFGTGVNLSTSDPGSTQVQTIYSVWDNTIYAFGASSTVTGTGGSVITGTRNTALVQQTQTTANGRYFGTSSNPVTYSRTLSTARRGWFFDLPVSRERVLNHPMAFEGQVIRVDSTAPAAGASGETCDLSVLRGSGYINLFNIHSGKPPETAVFGTNELTNASNGNRVQYGAGDTASVDDFTNNRSELFVPEATCPPGDAACYQCPTGETCAQDECLPGEEGCTKDEDECPGLQGRFLTMCQSVAGRRTDWREFR